MGDDLAEKVGGFAVDATADTFADRAINSAIDGVASRLPGGGTMDTIVKTGVDLAANNAINGEIGRVEEMFGGHSGETAEPPADAAAK